MKPLVSVILPLYNAERYIEKTMESVLGQTYSHFELVIVSDCPSDSTLSLVEEYKDPRIQIIYNEKNSGIAYSRNIGIANSSGKYIALMDHDDISVLERFEKQVDFLEKHPEIDVVGGKVQFIDENDCKIQMKKEASLDWKEMKALLLLVNPYSNSEVMFRRKLIEEHNITYQDNMLGLEDFRFWIDCSKVGKLSNIQDLLLYHRVMKSSETGKVLQERLSERLTLYADLQKYSLEKSGFRLQEEQMQIIQKAISDGCGACESGAELKAFYGSMQELVRQAQDMQCDFLDGVLKVCKQYFIGKSFTMQAEQMWQ